MLFFKMTDVVLQFLFCNHRLSNQMLCQYHAGNPNPDRIKTWYSVVGRSFLLLAQISPKLVNKVKKNNHHRLTPKISPGIIITAFAAQLANSTVL
jgi:hypothetical protein